MMIQLMKMLRNLHKSEGKKIANPTLYIVSYSYLRSKSKEPLKTLNLGPRFTYIKQIGTKKIRNLSL